MKKYITIGKEDLLAVNGGSEETYDVGYKVGTFFGKIGGFIKEVREIFY